MNPHRMIPWMVIIACMSLSTMAWAEPRHALLIGNAAYQPLKRHLNKLKPLRNPVNDAEAMDNLLAQHGFRRRTLKPNVHSKAALKTSVNRFAKALPQGATALVYYSGHGIGAEGKNYLLPTGNHYDSEADVLEHGISAEWLLSRLNGSRAERLILVLDACRDHMPLDESKGGPGEEGFGNILTQGARGKGTLIAYASSKGETAFGDRANDLSLYTDQLIRAANRHAGQHLSIALSETYSKVVEISSNPRNRGRFPEVQRPRFDWGMDQWCLAVGGCRGDAPPPRQEGGGRIARVDTVVRERPALPKTVFIDGMDKTQLTDLRRRTALALGIAEQYDEDLGKGVTMRIHLIPGGRFSMGSPEDVGDSDEHPQHQVTLKPYYMAQTELTQAQWLALMDRNRSNYEGRQRPVEGVSWDDTQAYIRKLGSGIPTANRSGVGDGGTRRQYREIQLGRCGPGV